MAYESYATPDQVADYMGVEVGTLPANITSIIQKVSDLITNNIFIRIEEKHHSALTLATCAQVEYFLLSGIDENSGPIKSYSAGSVSVTFGDGWKPDAICTRARGYLLKEGLLYRGIGMTYRENLPRC